MEEVKLRAGVQIGHWLLLRQDSVVVNFNKYWYCRCLLCKREYRVRHYNLRTGRTQHCLMCNPGRPGPFDIEPGTVFHWWTVLRRATNIKAKKRIYFCQCKCGVQRYLFGYALRKGITKSCGCGHAHFYNITRDKRRNQEREPRI